MMSNKDFEEERFSVERSPNNILCNQIKNLSLFDKFNVILNAYGYESLNNISEDEIYNIIVQLLKCSEQWNDFSNNENCIIWLRDQINWFYNRQNYPLDTAVGQRNAKIIDKIINSDENFVKLGYQGNLTSESVASQSFDGALQAFTYDINLNPNENYSKNILQFIIIQYYYGNIKTIYN